MTFSGNLLPGDEPAKFLAEADNTGEVMGAARGLLIVTAALVTFGLTMLYSASSGDLAHSAGYFKNQLLWVAIGGTGAGTAFFLGYRRLARWGVLWMLICAALLLAALLFGREINGAKRWIQFAGFTLQPSELAKVAVALYTANYCSENLRSFSNLFGRRGILPLGLMLLLVTGLIFAGRDLGTTLLVGAMAFFTLVAAGLAWYYWVVPAGFLTAVGFYIALFDHNRLLRVTSFMRPEEVGRGAGYQLLNSLLALGSGGWFGAGLMDSRMKARYLPEAHTDFILAVVGEELGYAAILGVLVLYTLWGFFALRIALRANSRLGMLLGWALTIGVVLQAGINMAVISGLAPTKGMPAPFVSYGGSNLVGCLIATGLLVSIAADAADPGCNDRWCEAVSGLFGKARKRG